MKVIKITTIIIFFVILLAPVAFFNTKNNQVSEIDNRKLQEFPTSSNNSGDYTTDIENYVNDRIGGRTQMINAYTILNDKLFNVMVHPSYTYGKEGYVFFKTSRNIEYGDYHKEFAQMVKKIQTYCEERGVPFLFCFEPYKGSVLSQYMPDGVNYDSSWTDELMAELDALGVNYIDNTDILIEKSKTEQVFNVKYDAGHWNYLGAFYGVNNMLTSMKRDWKNIEELSLDNYDLSYVIETSLPVSQFTINEEVPLLLSDVEIADVSQEYSTNIQVDPSYPYFHYWINKSEDADKLPKTLMFQGSYMNTKGGYLFKDGVGEYIAVHNYQNVLNFDYYFNIFQPEYVVFEVTEYTLKNKYFNYGLMKNLTFNPAIETLELSTEISEEDIEVILKKKQHMNDFTVNGIPDKAECAYICVDDIVLDLIKGDDGIYRASLADNNIIVGDEVEVFYVLDNCMYNLVIMTE